MNILTSKCHQYVKYYELPPIRTLYYVKCWNAVRAILYEKAPRSREFAQSVQLEKRGIRCLCCMQWGIIFPKQYLSLNASNQKTKATFLSKTFNFVYWGTFLRSVYF